MKRGNYTKHINHTVICAVCQKPFGASRSTAKYCSEKCRRMAYYAKMGYLGTIRPEHIAIVDPKSELEKLRAKYQPQNTAQKPTLGQTEKEKVWTLYGYVVSTTKKNASYMINYLLDAICAENNIQGHVSANSRTKDLEDTNFKISLYQPTREERIKIKNECMGISFTDAKEIYKIETFGTMIKAKSVLNVPRSYVLKKDFSKSLEKR